MYSRITSNIFWAFLPQKTDYTFLSIRFNLDKTQSQKDFLAIAHLLEHYLVNDVRVKDGPDLYEVQGDVSADCLTIHFRFYKKDAIKSLKDIFNIFQYQSFDNEDLFVQEKKRVISELAAKNDDLFEKLYQISSAERFIGFNPYKEDYNSAIEAIKSIKIDDIKKLFSKINKNKITVFSAYKPNIVFRLKTAGLLKSNLSGLNYEVFDASQKMTLSDKSERKIEFPGLSNAYALIVLPGISTKEDFKTEVLFQELISWTFYRRKDNISDKLQKYGIYDLRLKNFSYGRGGFIMIYFGVLREDQNKAVDLILDRVKTAIGDLENNEKDLNALRRNIEAGIKKELGDNNTYREILLDYLFYRGGFDKKHEISSSDMLKNIKKIKEELFRNDKANIFFCGNLSKLSKI